MRRFSAAILLLLFLLSGCTPQETALSPAIEFRAALANGCRFHAQVSADFGETVASFAMDCETDSDGVLRLTVTEPETLSGITATVKNGGGTITYDGMVLEFGLLANGNVIPAAAPAIAADCWSRAYIASAGQEDALYRVTYEKDFDEKRLVTDTWFENGVPICAEVCYNGQRILKILISSFTLN